MNLATLGIKIDPTGATAGAETAKKALRSIANEAKSTSAAVEGAGKAAAASASTAGRAQAAAHSGTLSRMADSMRSFFQRSGAAAGQTNGIFQGLVGTMMRFLQNMLMMVPGATGMFVGMASAAGSAATAMAGTAAAGGALAAVLLPLIAALMLLVGAFAALGAAVVFGDKMTQSIGKIAVATKDVKAAEAVYEQLYQNSIRTGASLDDSASSFVRFSIAGRSVGATNQQVLQLVETIQKAGVVSGATAQEISGATFQLSQALSSGKLSGDELRAVLEGMPILAEKLAKELGVSIGALRQMGADGKLTSDVVFPALLRTTAQIRQEFDTIPPSLGRGFSSLMTAIGRVFADLDKASGLSSAIARGFQEAALWIDQMRVMIAGLAENGTLWEALWLSFKIGARSAVEDFFAMLQGLKDSLSDMLMGAFNTAANVFRAMNSSDWWSGFKQALLANADSFGAKVVLWMNQAAAAIGAGLDVAAAKASNAMETVRTLGGTIGTPAYQSVDYNTAYNERLGPAQSNYDAQIAANTAKSAEGVEKMKTVEDAMLQEFQAGMDSTATLFGGLAGDLGGAEDQARLDKLIKEGSAAGAAAAGGGEAGKKALSAAGGGAKAGGGGSARPKAEEFHGDMYIMKEFQKQMAQMQALQGKGQMTGEEFGYRSEKLKDSTVNSLGDPKKYAEALGQWRVFQEEKARIAEDTDRRIQSGNAGMWESFSAGMNKAADQWGNTSQQMAKLGAGVANALSSNMTNAFMSMVDGSKSASEAFRDMAIAILNDIAKMIIQLLVELAVRTAIKAISGFVGGGSVGGGSSTGGGAGQLTGQTGTLSTGERTFGGSTAKMATGGPVWGGSGGIDDIPAYLTAGEYVIPKDAAEYYGTRFLDAVRERKARRVGFAEGGSVASMQMKRANSNAGAGVAKDSGVNVSFAVNVNGGDGQSREAKRKQAEHLAKQIESSTRQILREEMRAGGALSNR